MNGNGRVSERERERAHHPWNHHKHRSHSHPSRCCKHQHISRKTTPSFPRKDEMSATWWLMVIKRIQICVLIDICTVDRERAIESSLCVCYLQMWQSHHHHYTLYWCRVYGNTFICHYHSTLECLVVVCFFFFFSLPFLLDCLMHS